MFNRRTKESCFYSEALEFQDYRNVSCEYILQIDFEKVFSNVESIKVELNILNSLIGSKNIEEDFDNLRIQKTKALFSRYPDSFCKIKALVSFIREKQWENERILGLFLLFPQ